MDYTMDRLPLYHGMPPPRYHRRCARALIPLLAWLCVALSLRYGYYGNKRLALGPNSSWMMSASSIFVEQIQVKGEAEQGVVLHGFEEKPELSLETNWSVSKNLFVDSYGRKGFAMWLNEGSRISISWNVDDGSGLRYDDVIIVLIKGEQNLEEFQRLYYTNNHSFMGASKEGGGISEYTVPDDNSYYFGLVNLTPRSVAMTMELNITSKIYDTSKANRICSTSSGPCKLDLRLLGTRYYVLTTPDGDVRLKVWNIEISFAARLIVYFFITGFVIVIVYFILKHLGACNNSQQTRQDQTITEAETEPIVARKEMPCTYGATEEDPESSLCCSSEDLYDGKICVICYDARRDCFFTPCGHCATCFTCGLRIVQEENKVCPICRRLIHKLRRLQSP
ncbi:E3 ubiquitin-protein ligase APD2-like isoform X1 [Typha latifolia]|uniref:E3 ubiquitin-protein ligase APD2-like isoform X1 n=2 Tax=Typha latifolia TaxID=4733 RepID=UPI003C2FEF34